MKNISIARFLALTTTTALLCAHGQAARREVIIAAAANLNQVFNALAPPFEAATGIHPVFSFASTAQLALQIENGAPFDVYAAADVEHAELLEKKGLLLPGSRAVYATGILALWIPSGSAVMQTTRISDLLLPAVKVIVLPKPELAPYGEAARETLQRLGLWVRLQPKIVYADNVGMARQYGATGNADAVFTAYSLVMRDKGSVLQLDPAAHRPIDQAVGIVSSSKHQAEARQFLEFLFSSRGRDVLRKSGYRLPASAGRPSVLTQ